MTSPSPAGSNRLPPQVTAAPQKPAAKAGTIMTPAVAARIRQLAAQTEHRRAITEFRARHAAEQQTRVNTLLLETVAALASLLSAPASHACPAPRQAPPPPPAPARAAGPPKP